MAAAPWWDEHQAKALICAGAQIKSSHFVGTGGFHKGDATLRPPYACFSFHILFARAKRIWPSETLLTSPSFASQMPPPLKRGGFGTDGIQLPRRLPCPPQTKKTVYPSAHGLLREMRFTCSSAPRGSEPAAPRWWGAQALQPWRQPLRRPWLRPQGASSRRPCWRPS